jgi:CshA-type fibril repeat protein
VTITPNANFTGTVTEPVRYQVEDQDGQLVSALITPSVFAPATADPETSLGSKGVRQWVDLIDGDTSSDSNVPLDRSSVRLSCTVPTNCTVSNNGTRVEITGAGVYELDAANPGFVFFTPSSTFVGEAPSVTYTVQDVNGPISSTYTPTVVDMVVIEPDESIGPANEPQSRNVLDNDNIDGAQLRPETLQLRNPLTQELLEEPRVQVPGEGEYEFEGSTITFTPNLAALVATLLAEPQRIQRFYQLDEDGNQVLGLNGEPILIRVEASIAPITYQLLDSEGRVVTATYSPVVIFDSPVAEPDFSRGPADAPQSQRVLSNDASVGTELLSSTLQLLTPSGGEVIGANQIRLPQEGDFTFDGESIFFTPNMDALVEMLRIDLLNHQGDYSQAKLNEIWENGVYLGLEAEITTITYTVVDEFGFLVSTTYTPKVFFPKPAAAPDHSSGAINEPQTINIMLNDDPSKGVAFELDYLRIWDPSNGGSWGITPVETEEGVYSIEAAEGVVLQMAGHSGGEKVVLATRTYESGQYHQLVFMPKFDWTGTATPIRYQVRDIFGQKVDSTFTPSIEDPTVVPPEEPEDPTVVPPVNPEEPVVVKPINNLAVTGSQPLEFAMVVAVGLVTIGLGLRLTSIRRRNPRKF